MFDFGQEMIFSHNLLPEISKTLVRQRFDVAAFAANEVMMLSLGSDFVNRLTIDCARK